MPNDEDNINNDSRIDWEKERNSYKILPIYKKAEHLTELTKTVADTLNDYSKLFNIKEEMLACTDYIEARIVEIHFAETYIEKMENATMLKLNAIDLLEYIDFCELENFCDKDYLQTLTGEIHKFRKMFIQWIGSFEKSKPMNEKDDWGLF